MSSRKPRTDHTATAAAAAQHTSRRRRAASITMMLALAAPTTGATVLALHANDADASTTVAGIRFNP